MPKFSDRSKSRLITCDDRLQDLFNEVVEHFDCTVLCGHRNREDQEKAYREGKSKARWGQSNHNTLPSMAVDVVPYPIDWNDIQRFHHFAGLVLGIAAMKGINIRWGGHFKNFFDGPHFEIME